MSPPQRASQGHSSWRNQSELNTVRGYRRTAGQLVCKRVRSTLLTDMHSRISASKCNYTNHKSSML